MNRNWRKLLASFLVSVLVAALCFGCAKEEKGDGVIITIGQMTDLTGPGAPADFVINHVINDVINYYNEEGLIPGVRIKLATWDTNYKPAREIPGYEWLKDRGAQVIISIPPSSAETLKPFAERDKVAVCSLSVTSPMIEPPGWVFGFNTSPNWEMKTLLKWISENHWDYTNGTIPKVGMVGWSEPFEIEMKKGMTEYCEKHPDQFEWVGGFLAPVGTMMWGGEVEKLKDCDYIAWAFGNFRNFVKEFHIKGYTTTHIGPSSVPAYRGFLVDMFGWEPPLDGWLSTSCCPWWDEPSPIGDLAKEMLNRYHPDEAEDLIYEGSTYVGTFHNVYAVFEILRKAIEEVGAENFDGEAFYNAAIHHKLTWEGYPEYAFTEIKRYLVDDIRVYQWSAEVGDLVRVSDWLPLVCE